MTVVRLRPLVVVADDEPDILRLAHLCLSRAGLAVLDARDGTGALDLIRGERPDACVLDVAMPSPDGLELVRLLRADEATRDTPILLLSAAAKPADMDAGLDAGADAYLTKPFRPGELVDRVRRLLSPAPR